MSISASLSNVLLFACATTLLLRSKTSLADDTGFLDGTRANLDLRHFLLQSALHRLGL